MLKNDIDVYVVKENKTLLHLWENDRINWKFQSETLAENVSSAPVVTRWQNDINVYFFDANCDLIHLWTSPSEDWKYRRETLITSVHDYHGLTALRTRHDIIDVYFVSCGRISHLHSGNHTNWKS